MNLLHLVVFVLSVDTLWAGHVGTTCQSNDECTNSPFTYMSHCEDGYCCCDPGYIPMGNNIMCVPIEIGTPCPTDGTGDAFCAAGIENTICHEEYHVCVCLPNYEFQTSWFDVSYECVLSITPEDDPDCTTCVQNKGVCYGTPEADTCGCPRWYKSSGNSLETGCDQLYATPGQHCEQDGSIICIDPDSVCQHDGTLSMESTCVCPAGFVEVPDPYDPRTNYCALDIDVEYDPDCETCITNGGQCFDSHWDGSMDGCWCPFPKVSPTNHPADACTQQLASVECTSDSLVLCIDDKDAFDHHFGELGVVYTEGYLNRVACHLKEENDGKWCLRLSYDSATDCGVVSSDSDEWTSYSVWILFQMHNVMQSAFDLSMYGYCTYHKESKVATGLVDVEVNKIRHSTGVSLKPVVDMNTYNKYGANLEEVGATLGEEVNVVLEIEDDKGVFVSLRAEVCVISNMLSLNHPHAQSAVFILDGCPVQNTLFSQPIVFVPDLANPLKIASNYFNMPKFSTDIVFFHCAMKVCLNADECQPEPCNNRRKRDVVYADTKAGSRVRRSAHDVLQDRLESEDLMQKTVGVRINDPSSSGERLPSHYSIDDSAGANLHQKNLEDLEQTKLEDLEEIFQENSESGREEESAQSAPLSTTVVIVSTVGGCLATMAIGLLIVVLMQRRPVPEKEFDPHVA